MKNKMSLREFAEKIGVSPGTVSKALNPNPKYRISPQKSVYIQEKAREYGFLVSSETRAVRKQKKDLRIGLVCGSALSMLGGFLWEGAQEYCLSQGAELLVDCCGYSLGEENTALRRMAGKQIDALIYWSTCRDAAHRNSRRLFSRANNVAAALPLIYIGDTPVPESAFSLLFHDEQFAAETAKRHIKSGCRNFVILRFNYAWSSDFMAAGKYRETLLVNGVPEQNIREVCAFADSDAKDLSALKNADALWTEHGFMLYTHLEWLARYTDLHRLHVGGVGFIEFALTFQNLFYPTLKALNRKAPLAELFADSATQFYSLRRIGETAAQKAIEIARNPAETLRGEMSVEYLTEDEINAMRDTTGIFSFKKQLFPLEKSDSK